jgi:hypothetical protein
MIFQISGLMVTESFLTHLTLFGRNGGLSLLRTGIQDSEHAKSSLGAISLPESFIPASLYLLSIGD